MSISKVNLTVAIVCFLAGAGLVYLCNLSWIKQTQNKTSHLIEDFNVTYDIQQKLIENYSQSYDLLAQCLAIEKDNCNRPDAAKKLENIKTERNDLKAQLNASNKAISYILNK